MNATAPPASGHLGPLALRLRILGRSTARDLASDFQMPVAEVEATLCDLVVAGLVEPLADHEYRLTASGRAAVEESVHGELRESGFEAAVERAYRRFGGVDEQVRSACAHGRIGQEIADDLRRAHSAVRAPLLGIGRVLPRFQRHVLDLDAALAALGAEETTGVGGFADAWEGLRVDFAVSLGPDATAPTH